MAETESAYYCNQSDCEIGKTLHNKSSIHAPLFCFVFFSSLTSSSNRQMMKQLSCSAWVLAYPLIQMCTGARGKEESAPGFALMAGE